MGRGIGPDEVAARGRCQAQGATIALRPGTEAQRPAGTGRPASASTVTRESAPSASPSPRGSTPSSATTSPRRSVSKRPVGVADVLLLQRQPLAPLRPAAHVAEPPLAGQRLGDDAEDLPRRRLGPRLARRRHAPGSSSSPPPCAARRRGRSAPPAAAGRWPARRGTSRSPCASAGQAPRKRQGARTARPPATSRSRTRSSAREVSRSAGSITTSEPPGASVRAASASSAARFCLGPVALPELVDDVAERDEVGRPPAGQLGQRLAMGRVPLPRRERLAGEPRQLARGRERLPGPVAGGHLGRPGVERREGQRPGAAAEVEHGAGASRQLGEDAARLQVGDRPVEEQVGAEQPLVVEVAGARPAPGPGSGRWRGGSPPPLTSRSSSGRSASGGGRGPPRRGPRRAARQVARRRGIQALRSSAGVPTEES